MALLFRPPPLSDCEDSLLNAGIHFGLLCKKLWNIIDALSEPYAPPIFFKCVVDVANNAYIDEEVTAKSSTFDGDFLDPFNGSTLGLEGISDSVSELYFRYLTSNKNTGSKVDLPDTFTPVPREIGLISLHCLHDITKFRYCFDRVLFLGSRISTGDDFIRLLSENDESQEYIRRRCVATSIECDNAVGTYFEIKSLPEHYIRQISPYKIVSSVTLNGASPYFSFSDVCHFRNNSRMVALRRYVYSEYFFDTFDEAGKDAAYAWDVIFSLCRVIADCPQAAQLVTADYKRNDLVDMVKYCLGITRQRARLAIECLTLHGKAQDGAWSKPILPLDRTYVKILFPSVLTINPVRFLHLLSANLRVRERRGHVFEQKAIDQINGYCAKKQFTQKLTVLPKAHPIYRMIGQKKPRQILSLLLGLQ